LLKVAPPLLIAKKKRVIVEDPLQPPKGLKRMMTISNIERKNFEMPNINKGAN
jgi:hypothetical protein